MLGQGYFHTPEHFLVCIIDTFWSNKRKRKLPAPVFPVRIVNAKHLVRCCLIDNRVTEPSRVTWQPPALFEGGCFSSSGEVKPHCPHAPCLTPGSSAPAPPMGTKGWSMHIRSIQKLHPMTDTLGRLHQAAQSLGTVQGFKQCYSLRCKGICQFNPSIKS